MREEKSGEEKKGGKEQENTLYRSCVYHEQKSVYLLFPPLNFDCSLLRLRLGPVLFSCLTHFPVARGAWI